MKTISHKSFRYFATAFIFILTLSLVHSCEDDNVGDLQLSGNIKNLIPEDSYKLNEESSYYSEYFAFYPDFDSRYSYWGIGVKQVDYYVDGVFYKSCPKEPYDVLIKKVSLEEGAHTVLCKMTVGGEGFDDAVLEMSKEIKISPNTSGVKRRGDFYIDWNFAIPGEYLEIKPELLTERSSEGCAIDEVNYYWDDTKIYTTTAAPYSLKYLIKEEAGSTHSLSVMIKYHDNYDDNLYFNWHYGSYKIYSSEDKGYIHYRTKSNYNEYKNGEVISFVMRPFQGKEKEQYSFEVYIDDTLVGSSSAKPWTINYKLSNLRVGVHKIRWKFLKGGKADYSTYETFVITE